ncbi:ATP-binding cassette domain-containing protein [Clostridium punense]|nr:MULTISPECIES: ABC transporter ATP-binding protein [Clostridium]
MLRVENLTKKYGNFQVLDGISFEVKRGSIYGFLGPNGAGKTTTMNILSGLIGFNGGDIYLNGQSFEKNKRQLLKKVGYLPQSPVFYGYMTAVEYLTFIGKLGGLENRKIKARIEEILHIVKLTDSAKRRIGGYSGGMKQRLGLAAALFNNPELVFLDEPTSALDPEGRMEVLDFIEGLKKSETTVFFSTHILSDIERVCDEVSILNQGKILVSDKLDNLKNKYIQPIFDIEFEENIRELESNLKSIPWIEKTVVKDNKANIYVHDIIKAKQELLGIIAKENNPVVSYNLRKSDLEDIFIRLVNNDDDL